MRRASFPAASRSGSTRAPARSQSKAGPRHRSSPRSNSRGASRTPVSRPSSTPTSPAIAYDAAGADELTFLDITASHENRDIMLDVVRRTAEACFMPLTVGGGVRTLEDIRRLLSSGADKVSINTAAVARRAFVREAAEKFGDQCIVVAIDAKKVSAAGEDDRWEIFTHGGRNPTGLDALAYA